MFCTNIFCICILLSLKYIPYYFEENWRPKKSATIHPSKTKVFGVKNEILIKYERIKWTASRKASPLLPGGKYRSIIFYFGLSAKSRKYLWFWYHYRGNLIYFFEKLQISVIIVIWFWLQIIIWKHNTWASLYRIL